MTVDAIIEIPMGTKNKYEVDKKTKRIKLDRVLYSSVSYPGEYGYIENTLADDGDALDILIMASTPTFPGCVVNARILGYLDMIDKGFGDQKVIAVVNVDPRFDHIKTLDDLPQHYKEEIEEFFKTYKRLQNIEVETIGYHSFEETVKLIDECKKRFNN